MNRLGIFFLVIIVGSLCALAVTWGIDTNQENKELMASLPEFPGATLVREWTVEDDENRTLVRAYASHLALPEAATEVTSFYSAHFRQNGWDEGAAHAAASFFSRGSDSVVLGRVGPELMEAPVNADLTQRGEVPAGTGFFFTLEVTADRSFEPALWR